MKVTSSEKLYRQMKPGEVYRRDELSSFSSAVDRDLKILLRKQLIRKPAAGLYYRPKNSRWGDVPAEEWVLVRAFLRTKDFLLTSSNMFNDLPLGLTQFNNVLVVYNRKRSGKFKLGGYLFNFKRPPTNYPSKLTKEFLYVDLLNNWKDLPEYSEELELKLKVQLKELSVKNLRNCAKLFGKKSTQVKLENLLQDAA